MPNKTYIFDKSPYGSYGTISGATWVRLPNGLWVLDFDGTDDHIEATCPQCNFTSGDFSIVAHVKIDDLTTHRWIVNRGLRNTDGYEFYVDPDGTVTFWTNQAAAGQYSTSALNSVTTGSYYTIGVSRSGTSAAVYSNGVSSIGVAGNHTDPLTSARTMKIGIHDAKILYPLEGQMFFLRVYNRALSAGEHKQIHDVLKWR